jgi:hypothetical protein
MFVSCIRLRCIGSGVCDGLVTRSEQSYWVYVCVRACVYVYLIVCDLKPSTIRGPRPDLGCGAIAKQN